uniref:Cobalamin adenosyltransferase-like domain-containing protein n=1 Tax=viral metagenome TaxID=1070528 RepID=A0A6C0J1K8_9ZZZZ
MSKIYTKKGDDGTTYTGKPKRELKSSSTSMLLGTIDELHVCLGKCCTYASKEETKQLMSCLAAICLDIGSIIYFINSENNKEANTMLTNKFINLSHNMEIIIDEKNKTLEPLTEFIVFANCTEEGITLHEARATTRRLERMFTAYIRTINDPPESIKYLRQYLNRLSDLLFTLARVNNGNGIPRSKTDEMLGYLFMKR